MLGEMTDRTGSPSDGSGAPPVVTVTVPARPDCVHVLRAVVGSVAARLSFSYEQIDDLRLATTEIVAHLLDEPPPPEWVTLKVTELDECIEVVATRASAARVWPPAGVRSSLTAVMLRALADDSSFDLTNEGSSIRFVKLLRV